MITKNSKLSIILLMSLAACAAPGHGVKAEKTKEIGDDLVRSIESYRTENEAYPRSIDDLEGYPQILSAANSANIKLFFVSNSPEHYELIIKYFGPGSNLCVHRSTDDAGIWSCTGAY
ncbi:MULTISPECIES: hypothetical protein [Xanthomonas]|uniref:hypothetical protein n=1 Tax=Xanthomonas TaxID=338 RepID=UPI002B23CA7D|nr:MULTISPECIES: hypothetical protein [Xanthomonas]MEA9565336.1 hypothetical protein [Xanthomonas sp. WHRI 8932A]MEA9579782.1 hypothetical protein [Xanthomonas nasturtii]